MSLVGLHHIHLKVRDLDGTLAFASDFGLTPSGEAHGKFYLRGGGASPCSVILERADESSLVALAFEVDSLENLECYAEAAPSARVEALTWPWGGSSVSLVDPEGLRIDLVAGVAKREPDPLPPTMIVNHGAEKARKGVWQHKAPVGPPSLLRLGHVGLFIRDWRACDHWYRNTLGLIPSDLLYAGPPENVIGGFYRIDRGEEWVDHHTIAFFQMGKTDLHHVSFEVPNSEAQFAGHRWMKKREHESIWGVGRHPLGSHIFDVWRDPSGYRFETFSDTDICNANSPSARHPIAEAEMDLWSDRHVDAYFA